MQLNVISRDGIDLDQRHGVISQQRDQSAKRKRGGSRRQVAGGANPHQKEGRRLRRPQTFLVAVPVTVMVVPRIISVVAMMAIVMMVAVIAMMVIVMVMIPSCGWYRAAGRNYTNNT